MSYTYHGDAINVIRINAKLGFCRVEEIEMSFYPSISNISIGFFLNICNR